MTGIGRLAATAAALLAPTTVWAQQTTQDPDYPRRWQTMFQEAASPTMDRIIGLADLLNWITFIIFGFVMALVGYVCWRFRASRNPTPATFAHNTPIEIAWTILPVLILVIIAFPSFRLLYSMDRTADAEMTLKVTGHQWYWSYEYPDQNLRFDANMIQESELKPGQPRLLATDNHVVLPVDTTVRIQLTADDVIHSWAVPALGIKSDTVPGRLNETWVRITRPGIYYGQCSELCGVNHGFMPITVEAVPKERFHAWLDEARTKFAANPAPVSVAANQQGN